MSEEIKLSAEALARIGYVAYGDAADWKAFNGERMPQWSELPTHIRHRWICAAVEIARAEGEHLGARIAAAARLAVRS